MFLISDVQIQSYIALSLLNNFLHKIRITSVPPILKSGETITNTNIIEKVNIFNLFFSVILWKTGANLICY